jgi:hypothetical protein
LPFLSAERCFAFLGRHLVLQVPEEPEAGRKEILAPLHLDKPGKIKSNFFFTPVPFGPVLFALTTLAGQWINAGVAPERRKAGGIRPGILDESELFFDAALETHEQQSLLIVGAGSAVGHAPPGNETFGNQNPLSPWVRFPDVRVKRAQVAWLV